MHLLYWPGFCFQVIEEWFSRFGSGSGSGSGSGQVLTNGPIRSKGPKRQYFPQLYLKTPCSFTAFLPLLAAQCWSVCKLGVCGWERVRPFWKSVHILIEVWSMCLCVHLLSKAPFYIYKHPRTKSSNKSCTFPIILKLQEQHFETTVRASEHGHLQHLLGEMCLLSLKCQKLLLTVWMDYSYSLEPISFV